jgi:hypothetical protein
MNKLDYNIIYLFYLIYKIDEKDKDRLLNAIKTLSDDEKKQYTIALFERYKAKIRNLKILKQDIKLINNKLEEDIENLQFEENDFNF